MISTNPLAAIAHPARVRVAWAVGAVLAACATAMAYAGLPWAMPWAGLSTEASMKLPPPSPPPLLLRRVDPADALGINRSIPFSREPNPPARPFKLRGDAVAYQRALDCLASAIYYEAANESPDGQRAVAQVVLNRVRHPAFVPSVCGVVYHGSTRATGCQFSFTCDGSLGRVPSQSGWRQARAIAAQALAGAVLKTVGQATHYHADYVVPYWATSLSKNAMIGRHIFYRWQAWWGTPAAFTRPHSGREADPLVLRNVALGHARDRASPAPESSLAIAVDPRVELMSIIQFLASGSPPHDAQSPYEKEVRAHFSRFSEHLAVQIYRQLSAGDSKFGAEALLQTLMHLSEPPKLELEAQVSRELVAAIGGRPKLSGFLSTLRDFVKHSEFESFFEKRREFYSGLAADAQKGAVALAADLEADRQRGAGSPLHIAGVTLAPLLAHSSAVACKAPAEDGAKAWLVIGVLDGVKPAVGKPAALKKALNLRPRADCQSFIAAALPTKGVKLVGGSEERAEAGRKVPGR